MPNRRCLLCATLTTRGSYCPAHTRARQREKNAQFGGSGWAWQRIRSAILERDGGRCVICNEPAVEVDHHPIRREHGGPSVPGNLRSVCFKHNPRSMKGRGSI